MRLIVIGGGIAGLAAAHRARTRADDAGIPLDVTLLEGSDRLGGKILTHEGPGGVPLEFGPDSFLAAKPRGRELAAELGLENDLVGPSPEAKRVYLELGGRLRELPEGLALGVPTGIRPLFRCLRNGLIGPGGALRAGIEPLLPATGGDLTVAEFMRRRLGSQVANRLIAPLVTGIFGASPDEVSMRAAFPQFAHTRSLVLTMARRPKGTGGSPFLSIRGGMSRLTDVLARSIRKEGTEILVNTPATRLAREGREFLVDAGGGRLRARAVLITTPAPVAAQLLREVAPKAAEPVGRIRYHSSAVIQLRYKREAIGRPLDGSGYLVAPEDRKAVAAGSWPTTKWPHIEWTDPWVRAMVVSPEILGDQDDEALERAVVAEVSHTLQTNAAPAEVQIHRWPEALPVYEPGHVERVSQAEEALPAGIAIAGAAYRGLGIPDCIFGGEVAAEAMVSAISDSL
jgi:oxygen-dependent protoporphyrinogen oxidase